MTAEKTTRTLWVNDLLQIVNPVFAALAQNTLKKSMPVESNSGSRIDRREVTHLEALGRSLAGVGPWLAAPHLDPDEAVKRDALKDEVMRALDHATDPHAPDFLNFSTHQQPMVDAAFLAHGLLRAYDAVWIPLDPAVKQRVVDCLKQTRDRKPAFNNWLLFAAMIETFLYRATADADRMRVDYAVRLHEQWYKGDGIYGDGPTFHWDYYNSYVIHPMLLDVVEAFEEWASFKDRFLLRAQRYAAIQERMIAPDGSFPAVGRSLAYRCGAFQLLAQMALRRQLPEGLTPAQVRCALTAVMARTLHAPGTYDQAGWLQIGLAGHQPSLGEMYISTGSLYLCTTAFLPLGLPPSDPFWSDPDQDWTHKIIWSGTDHEKDSALQG